MDNRNCFVKIMARNEPAYFPSRGGNYSFESLSFQAHFNFAICWVIQCVVLLLKTTFAIKNMYILGRSELAVLL